MAVMTIDQPLPAIRTGNVAYALSMAASVGVLTLTILLTVVAGLASGAIGLFGLPLIGAWIVGGLGALAVSWASARLALSTYRIERAGLASSRNTPCSS